MTKLLPLHISMLQHLIDGWVTPYTKQRIPTVTEILNEWETDREHFHGTMMDKYNVSRYATDLIQQHLEWHTNPSKQITQKLAGLTTVSQLIEQLQQYPPDTYIGGHGHFGELLDYNGTSLTNVYVYAAGNSNTRYHIPVVTISIEDPGPDPD